MARLTVWLATIDKPGSGELPDGGETEHTAYTCATAAKRGAVQFAKRSGIVPENRVRFPWTRDDRGNWIAAWDEDGDEIELCAVEVDLLTTKQTR